jgi:hypothetical protein
VDKKEVMNTIIFGGVLLWARSAFSMRKSTKLIHGKTYNTHQETKTGIFECIEVFYNRKCRHPYLGYLSHDEYKKKNVA